MERVDTYYTRTLREFRAYETLEGNMTSRR